MKEDISIHFHNSIEMFFIRGELVAQQPAYSIGRTDPHPEFKYFYCETCGEVWGKRLEPMCSKIPIHYYYRSKCKPCGGTENMLNPWEENHLDYLGNNVLAYLFLKTLEEKENENSYK